jgi:hypothetical protein
MMPDSIKQRLSWLLGGHIGVAVDARGELIFWTTEKGSKA